MNRFGPSPGHNTKVNIKTKQLFQDQPNYEMAKGLPLLTATTFGEMRMTILFTLLMPVRIELFVLCLLEMTTARLVITTLELKLIIKAAEKCIQSFRTLDLVLIMNGLILRFTVKFDQFRQITVQSAVDRS